MPLALTYTFLDDPLNERMIYVESVEQAKEYLKQFYGCIDSAEVTDQGGDVVADTWMLI